ncbi:MAG TPA: SRPBCC family protein [Candidatus Krumholzibacteria bacterium]
MDVRTDAKVLVTVERRIERPPNMVWKVLSDIEAWPEWNPAVERAQLSGALLPGAEFRWRASGVRIHSVLRDVMRPSRLSWTGKTMGLRAVHVWEIEAVDGGGASLVRSRESLDGWWLSPFRRRIQHSVERSTAAWLDALARRSGQEVHCG